jgi:hypothetical protein
MIFLNDASLHGQFSAFPLFHESLKLIWNIRKTLQNKDHPLRVTKLIRTCYVTSTKTFNDFIGELPRDIRTQVLIWLDRDGPFWEDDCKHDPGEYLECSGAVVTETGLGEAAHRIHKDKSKIAVVSFTPSSFESDPLLVLWKGLPKGDEEISVRNCWTAQHAERVASDCESIPRTWNELVEWGERSCKNLLLAPDISSQLGIQFFSTVADRAVVLLTLLDKIVDSIRRNDDAVFFELRRNWMEGGNARFTPSSNTELCEFASDLTFAHPETGESVLCSWHGKIKTPQFRIHFEWPLAEGSERLFVAYIGPKITKR